MKEASPRSEKSDAVYEKPLVYDIAFSFRDHAHEVDCLSAWFARASGQDRQPASVIELAAGPAAHALEFGRRKVQAAALDLSNEMCEYARQKASLLGVSLEVHQGDMVDFLISRRFELAMLMSNSVAHLYNLDGMVAHLRSVAAHLEPAGVYVLEVQHPSVFTGRGSRPTASYQPWTISRWGLEVETRWGSPDDSYDPVSQIFQAQVEIKIRDGDTEHVVSEMVSMRDWTLGELQAAIRLSEVFELCSIHGDFSPDAVFDKDSWRMILVLKKSR